MKPAWKLGWSVAVSAGLLWLIFREAAAPAKEVAEALIRLSGVVWGGYFLAQVIQAWLRAERYRILLSGAGSAVLPAPGRMFAVTLARNMFVDMLPARTGELSYWALLNRSERVAHADCVSTMTLSVLFDLLALALVLLGAVATPFLVAGGRSQLLFGAAGVGLLVGLAWLVLFYGVALGVRILKQCPVRLRGYRWFSKGEEFMIQLLHSLQRIRSAGVLTRALGYSLVIRAVKYAGLLVAFHGMARLLRPALAELPVWQVLIGLIAGEGGAALPVPTFLSLGSYEAAGAGAMRLAGVGARDAALVLLGTHVASQIVDYLLGGAGLLVLLWSRRLPALEMDRSEREAGRVPLGLMGISALALFFLGIGGIWVWQGASRQGATTAPGAGTVLAMGPRELAALDAVWGDRTGFVVWSSTMYGQHDLVMLRWPSGDMLRLTKHPHVDSMPKIAPDGRRVAFARSRQPWVSFRNWEEWDIWMLDLKTLKATKLAEHGTEPCWTGDGRGVVFQRGGRVVARVDVETGEETILLPEQGRLAWTGPSMDPAGGCLAVTIRKGRRGSSIFSLPDGRETRVAGGCQLAFVPGGEWLVLVEEGGRMKNRICRVDRNGRNLQTLLDMPGPWSHEYFPRVSNDGALLVFGAAREGHEHDTADYEIFLWRIGSPSEQAARLSFHTGNDQWPDIWVDPPPPPKSRKKRSS